jgi:hypothetical protein
MGILDRLIRQKKQDESIIWGIRTPKSIKTRWLMLAAVMRVPTNRLILFVLQDWTRQNADTLLDDKARNKLAEHIARLYLNNKLS